MTILFILSGFLLLRTGCVESVDNTGGSSGTSAPTMEISKPVTGDTVYVGQNEISYTSTDPSGQGLSRYEVFVNGTSTSLFEVGTSTNKIKIYLEVPETLLYQKIKYYVIAYSKSGKYKASKEQTGLYVKPTPPKAPGKLRITKESDIKFNLTWVDSSDNENRFELWRKDGASGSYRLLKSLTEGQFYTSDIVASAYTVYFYKVRAGHATGVSAFSNEVSTLIAPSNLQAKSTSVTAVDLSWNDNSALEEGFRIERALVNGEFEVIGAVLTNITSYRDETVNPATTYKYRVIAYAGGVSSPYSAEVNITTSTASTPPSQLNAAFNYSTRKIDVSWLTSNFGPNTVIERKDGYYGKFNYRATLTNSSSNTQKFSDDSSLVAKTYYYYRVRELINTNIYTAYSNEDTAYVPLLPPAKPTELTVTSELGSATRFILSWKDNANDEDGFELEYKDALSSTGTYTLLKTYGANSHADIVAVPQTGIIYSFRLRAFKYVDGVKLASDYSNEDYTSSPWALSLVNETKDYVVLRWNDNFSSPNEVYFSLERKLQYLDDTNFKEIKKVPASYNNSVIYTDTQDLTPGETYVYRVKAVFQVGSSGYSNTLKVQVDAL